MGIGGIGFQLFVLLVKVLTTLVIFLFKNTYSLIAGHILFLTGAKNEDGMPSMMLQPDGNWSIIANLPTKRSRACAVSYTTNKVALIGGRNMSHGTYPKLVCVYDVRTKSFENSFFHRKL